MRETDVRGREPPRWPGRARPRVRGRQSYRRRAAARAMSGVGGGVEGPGRGAGSRRARAPGAPEGARSASASRGRGRPAGLADCWDRAAGAIPGPAREDRRWGPGRRCGASDEISGAGTEGTTTLGKGPSHGPGDLPGDLDFSAPRGIDRGNGTVFVCFRGGGM